MKSTFATIMILSFAMLLVPEATSAPADASGYRFEEKKGEYIDILKGNQKLVRYMNKPRDGTTKDTHELTFKPFYHVYDPAKGETLLTNGAGLASNKENLFPHHRGIFYAFNKVSYGKDSCDVWHGKNGEFVMDDGKSKMTTGDVATLASHLDWCGKDGKPFASEERTIAVSAKNGMTIVDFDSTLTTKLEKVRLDGDPQHSGCHFRAAMEVSKHGKQDTYYVRPDGKGKMGDTRNWDPKTKQGPVNLPWDACSFVIEGKRYTTLRVVHPDNPKDWRGSERDYGRFGDYFEWDLTPKTPLHVKYRYIITPGELTIEQCAELAKNYTAK